MAIRLRRIDGKMIALCAAKTLPEENDIYLCDEIHHSLSRKFVADFTSEGLIAEDVCEKLLAE